MGGLLGHWAVWTEWSRLEELRRCHEEPVSAELLALNVAVTDCNGSVL
ncbi:MAG UNVERIFIED_CONTAM: hypothetical protein LVR18_24975 [Planctomycetaceae bacterium]